MLYIRSSESLEGSPQQGTTTWIYGQDEYNAWKRSTLPENLWITGILGSGKTVLLANVVEDLTLALPASTTVYFFCTYDEAESLKARTIIGSIARQMLENIDLDLQSEPRLDLKQGVDEDQILECLRKLVSETAKPYYIILDGIDKCEEQEQKSLLSWFRKLQIGVQHAKVSIKTFASSRPCTIDWAISSLKPVRTMSMSGTNPEIENYIDSCLEQRLEYGDLRLHDPSLVLEIQDTLVKGADGMFLWVAFQIQSICAQKSDKDIQDTLRSFTQGSTPNLQSHLAKDCRS